MAICISMLLRPCEIFEGRRHHHLDHSKGNISQRKAAAPKWYTRCTVDDGANNGKTLCIVTRSDNLSKCCASTRFAQIICWWCWPQHDEKGFTVGTRFAQHIWKSGHLKIFRPFTIARYSIAIKCGYILYCTVLVFFLHNLRRWRRWRPNLRYAHSISANNASRNGHVSARVTEKASDGDEAICLRRITPSCGGSCGGCSCGRKCLSCRRPRAAFRTARTPQEALCCTSSRQLIGSILQKLSYIGLHLP